MFDTRESSSATSQDSDGNSSERNIDFDYCQMEFLHIAEAIPLNRVAEVLRPLVGSDFVARLDERVDSVVATWDEIEVIVAHPFLPPQVDQERIGETHFDDQPLTENNAGLYITVAIKRTSSRSAQTAYWQHEYAPKLASKLAQELHCDVLHSKSWELDLPKTTIWNRLTRATRTPEASHDKPVVFPSGWKRIALITTMDNLRPKYDGPLDFLFVGHPRTSAERAKPFPLARGLCSTSFAKIVPPCAILSPIEVTLENRVLRGELVGIPQAPTEMVARLPQARECLLKIMEYAAHREVKMVGLGALIPSISRQGRLLQQSRFRVPVTTGHGFTALTIANMVDEIEAIIGKGGLVAVMGAAGSTGRAALRCMFKRSPHRKILAVDLPEKLCELPRVPGWNPEVHQLSSLKEDIKKAAIVVCVTNAVGSILDAEDFGPNTVVLDDAQPENVSQCVAEQRPDLKIVKCLARIPGLYCPYDMGLLSPSNRNEQINFTCLAETILLAAENHQGSFVVGDPTDEQFQHLQIASSRHKVTPASFYSFPDIGKIELASETPKASLLGAS